MSVMEQANKLKGKEKEEFLKEYREAKQRLKEAQTYTPVKKKATRKSKPRNGKVITYNINELEGK